MLLMLRADLELGRGDFDAARSHLEAALATLREDRGQGIYDVYLAELALWERRWTEVDQAVHDGMAKASSPRAAQLHVWFCAKGLRAHAELAALARARRDADAVRTWLARARKLIAVARRAANEASAVTPNTRGWQALAEAEYERARGVARPDLWSEAAATWDAARTPAPRGLLPLARGRGARRSRRGAHGGERAAQRGIFRRGSDRSEAACSGARAARQACAARPRSAGRRAVRSEAPVLEENLGLTPREAEVLTLVARGYTNREIADALVISVKTASVHVSHILRKLAAPNRREAAAIAHRLSPPPDPPP